MTSFIFCATTVVVFSVIIASNESCYKVESSRNEVNCTFSWSWCSWRNLPDNDVNWKRLYASYEEGWLLKADMDSARSGHRAALVSSVICATKDRLYALNFSYYLQSSEKCMLSVSLRSEGEIVPVWNTTRASHPDGLRWSTEEAYVTSPTNSFQIIVEAKKLSKYSCGTDCNKIYLDNISLRHAGFLPPTTAAATTATTASPSTDSQTGSIITTDLPSAPSDKKGSHASVTIGICVLVIVIIAAIIVCIIMRRKQGALDRLVPYFTCLEQESDDAAFTSRERTISAVSNEMYTTIANTQNAHASNRGRILSESMRPSSEYELNHYSLLGDVIFQPAGASPFIRATSNGLTTSQQHTYNKLSFEPSGTACVSAVPANAYDHLNDTNLQSTDTGEYCIVRAEIQSGVSSRPMREEKPEYVNLDDLSQDGEKW